jgi:ABC-type sugar transport system permease subunit
VASVPARGNNRNTVGPGEPKGLRAWWSRSERKVVPYVFISPFYILFIVFSVGPLMVALYLSLFRWPGSGPMRYVGLGNYEYLTGDPIFLKSLGNTIFYAVGAFIFILPIALLLALLINSSLIRLKSLFRIGYFLPILTSTVAATIMFLLIFNNQFGLINQGLALLGIPPLKWLDEELVKISVLLVATWRYTGINVLYFLTGLQSIPPELYEAAQVDGAGTWARFRYITIPQLRPIALFVGVVTMIGSFQLFAEPLLLTGGGPNDASLTIANYLYRMGFTNAKLGYGSAIGWVLALIIFGLSFMQLYLFGAFRKED